MVLSGVLAKRMDALTNMDDLKAKMLEEITKLEHELRNELPKEILKARMIRGMNKDFSWAVSAEAYSELYEALLGRA